MTTWPFHYRDTGEPCPWSGVRHRPGVDTCPYGCNGSRFHYANDGHPECDDEDPDRVQRPERSGP